MAWIPSYQTLRDHKKTRILMSLLGADLPTTIGYLHLLWWWLLDNAPDGDLTDIPPEIIADVAGSKGSPKKFIAALVKAGFLDKDKLNGSLTIHNWNNYTGRLLMLRQKNRDRMRESRDRTHRARAENSETESLSTDASVQNTCSARAEHVQGLQETTQHNITRPKKEGAFAESSNELRLSKLFYNLIQRNDLKARPPGFQKWAKQVDLLIRKDGRTPDEVEKVMRWCQNHSFWHANILSTKKLREKFPQLTLQMRQDEGNGPGRKGGDNGQAQGARNIGAHSRIGT